MQPASSTHPAFALDHTGLVVPDLDAAVAFYAAAFDMTVVSRESDTDVPSAAIGLPGEHVRLRGAILRAGTTYLELHQYLTPVGTGERRVCDTGFGHIAFAVPDINEAYRFLIDRGVTFNSEPQLIATGGLAGRRWVYGQDPWGNVIELGQNPTNESGPA